MTERGAVSARLEPEVRVRLRGPAGNDIEVTAVIDTGYTGSLTLPVGVASSLGLARQAGGRAVLADGSVRRFDTFAAEVLWGGAWVGVVVSAVGDGCCWACRFWPGAGCGSRPCRAVLSRSGRWGRWLPKHSLVNPSPPHFPTTRLACSSCSGLLK